MSDRQVGVGLKDPVLWMIIAAGAALRLIGLRWGLPDAHHLFSYHPDEVTVALPAAWMLETGDLNPHFFNYGPLYIYLLAGAGWLARALGFLSSQHALGQLHLIGRVVTVIAGTATIPVVYFLGARLGGRSLGLVAAAVMAALPLHVVHSHFATVDVTATFFIAVALWAMVELVDGGRLGWYLAAGAAIGLAAATKWTMATAVVPLFAAHLVARGTHGPPPPLRRLLAALVAMAVAFLLVCPYIFTAQPRLSFNPEFVHDLRFEQEHARAGGTLAFADTGPVWRYQLGRGLPAGLGYALAVAAAAGFWIVMVRGGAAGMVCVVWALVAFLSVLWTQERFIRYTLPMMPVVAVFGAGCFVWPIRPRWPALRAALAALGAAIIGVTLWYTAQNLAAFVRPDPRDQAAAWLQPRLKPGVSVGLAEPPWFFTPPITPFNGGLRNRAEFEDWRAKAPFRVAITGWEADRLREAHPDYYALSDFEWADRVRLRQPAALWLMRALDKDYTQRALFKAPPVADFLGPRRARCPPDWLYARPEVAVYEARR